MAKLRWQFKTRNFTVRWLTEPDALDTTGLDKETAAEWARNIRSGKWKCFQSEIQVVCNATGILLGEAMLGNNIYAKPADFRDHFGITAKGCGSYFKQMVLEAVAEARRRFPAHQKAIEQELRKKQRVVGVKLRTKKKVSAAA